MHIDVNLQHSPKRNSRQHAEADRPINYLQCVGKSTSNSAEGKHDESQDRGQDDRRLRIN